jgi:hypothetical protein
VTIRSRSTRHSWISDTGTGAPGAPGRRASLRGGPSTRAAPAEPCAGAATTARSSPERECGPPAGPLRPV